MPVRIRWTALGAVGITVIAIIVTVVFMSRDDAPSVVTSPTPSDASGEFVPLTPFQARVLGFDVLDKVNLPQDNPFSEAKVALGRLLSSTPGSRLTRPSVALHATSRTRAGQTVCHLVSGTRDQSTGATHLQSSTPLSIRNWTGTEKRSGWTFRRRGQ